MNTITTAVKAFVSDENGVTAIEYGLMAALIAGAIAATVTSLAGGLDNLFLAIKAKLVMS